MSDLSSCKSGAENKTEIDAMKMEKSRMKSFIYRPMDVFEQIRDGSRIALVERESCDQSRDLKLACSAMHLKS